MSSRAVRIIILSLVVIVWVGVIGFRQGTSIMSRLTSPDFMSCDDFVEYWSAGRLNLAGANPYDRESLTQLQHQAGRFSQVPVMMWNPPWTIALAMPFGALPYPLARLIWLLASLIFLIVCADWLWQFYGGPIQRRWVAVLVALAFGPTIILLKVGQIGTWILLGCVGFLFFDNRQRSFLAGCAVALILIKPHLCYLLLFALFLREINKKDWLFFAGAAFALLVSISATLLINPQIVNQYMNAARSYPPTNWATPTLGGILRWIVGEDIFLLQFLPPISGIVWFFFHYWHHANSWKWSEQMPLLLITSVLTAPYGWPFDYVVLIIPILQVMALYVQRGATRTALIAGTILLLISGLSLIPADYFWLFWLAPTLFICYIGVRLLLWRCQPTG